ncbi:ankyrin repeat domain-containing protein 31 isoform X1 [Pleurodeles waltl]|uniref:ankyrin repeat domain-containing protein 31 isoform X1 n=1 Tax=Pleurodeles waltl TaxID=8319 RepID=UPI003709C3D1
MEAGDAHDLSDCDSDRTMVEGSVVDSDFEEDELHVNRLIFINSSDAIPTAVHRGSEKELPSPEIQLICRVSQQWKDSPIKDMLIDQEQGGLSESPERNLLTGAIISVPKTPSNNDKQLRMLEKVAVQNLPAHSEVCDNGTIRKIAVAVTDTDTTVRLDNVIRRKTSVQNKPAAEEGELKVADLLKPLSDSESPRDIMSMKNMLMSQKNIASMDESAVENGNVLPNELIKVINALSDTAPDFVIAMPASSLGNSTGVNVGDTGSYNRKLSHSSTDDDSRQITPVNLNMLSLERNKQLYTLEDPQSTEKQKAQVISKFDKHDRVTSNDHPASHEQNSKNPTDVVNNSCMKSCEQSSFCLESTSRKRKCSSRCSPSFVKRKFTCHSDKSNAHPSDGQNKEGNENTELVHNSLHLCTEDIDTQSMTWLRRSRRKTKSTRYESCNRSSVNAEPTFPCLKASTINRKNMLGETKLHKAVMKDNLFLVHALIKYGANVNAQDHAGKLEFNIGVLLIELNVPTMMSAGPVVEQISCLYVCEF